MHISSHTMKAHKCINIKNNRILDVKVYNVQFYYKKSAQSSILNIKLHCFLITYFEPKHLSLNTSKGLSFKSTPKIITFVRFSSDGQKLHIIKLTNY